MKKLTKVSKSLSKEIRSGVCYTKEDLHAWIKTYLNIDLPDCIVSETSNCSPMDMIWWNYHNAIHSDHKHMKEALFIANRSGYKTLGASIVELLMVYHAKRDVVHLGAIQAQAKRCYQYFQNYFRQNDFRDILWQDESGRIKDPVMEKTVLRDNVSLEILPCTLAAVNGPHTPFVAIDEIDTVQDIAAYNDINGIPTKTHDGKPPLKMGISTRKTAAGLVAQTAESANETGIEVFIWNIIDLTQKCPDSRSLKKKINIYTNLDTLESLSEGDLKKLPIAERKKFEKREGYEGCLKNCRMFAACLGDLKKQKSESNILHEIEYVESEIFSKPVDWVNAQLLCRKPSMEGIIYSRYSQKDHVKTYQEMYEVFIGEPWPHDRKCGFDDIRAEFEKAGIRPVMGVDFGDHLATLLLVYIDGRDRAYVVKEQTFTATDDAELAEWARNYWAEYDVDMVYADPASPSGIRLLNKAGFNCHNKVDKDVWGGINTVRSFLRIPGTNTPGIMFHHSCTNILFELPRYHKKYNKSLNMIMEDPVKKDDHSLDNIRYILHTIFGQNQANLGFAGAKQEFNPKTPVKAPDAKQLADYLGVGNFADNKGDYIVDKKTGRLRRRKDSEYGDDDEGGFSF